MIASRLQNLRRYTGTTGPATTINPGGLLTRGSGSSPGVAFKPLYRVAQPASGGGGVAPSPLVQTEKMPWDAQYENVVGGINTNLNTTLAGLVNDENTLGADFGVAFDRAGDGALQNFRLDPTNPFSRAALLQRAYQQRQKSTTGQLASQGQLYSGYHQAKQNEATFDNQQAGDRLLKDFGGLARQIVERRQAAQNAAAGQIADAGWDRLGALSNQPAAPAPAPTPAAAPAAGQAPNSLAALIARYGGQNVKLDQRGLFYKRPSDGQWIKVTL